MFGKDNLAYKNMKYIKIMGGGKNTKLRVLEINGFVDSSFFSCLWKTFPETNKSSNNDVDFITNKIKFYTEDSSRNHLRFLTGKSTGYRQILKAKISVAIK